MDNLSNYDTISHSLPSEESPKHDISYKIIIIGSASVGKTSIINQALKNKFEEEYRNTIGVEFGAITVRIENKNIYMQIWDTAGEERFLSMTRVFYKGANVILLVYDISSRLSFNKLEFWLNEALSVCDFKTKIILIGNKSDLVLKREVTKEEAIEFANKQKLASFMELSAKSGENCNLLIIRIAKMLYSEKIENDRQRQLTAVSLDNYKENDKKCSC